MNNTDKLLRAFIEASGFDIKEIKREFYKGEYKGLSTEIHEEVIDYKVTKKPEDHFDYHGVDKDYSITASPVIIEVVDNKATKQECHGDLFSLGCQVANDDIRSRLMLLGFELDKNQMHDVMETIIFHIVRS